MRIGNRLFADISSNNGSLTASTYYQRGGCMLLGNKASEGVGYTNPLYGMRSVEMHQLKLCVLSYHFARVPEGNPEGQADRFIDSIRAYHNPRYDRTALDLEQIGSSGSPAEDVRWAQAYWKRMAQRGYPRGLLYAPLWWVNLTMAYGGLHNPHAPDLWIPFYLGPTSTPQITYSMVAVPRGTRLWAVQFSGGFLGAFPRSTPGIDGPCDMNLLNARTYTKLLAGGGL